MLAGVGWGGVGWRGRGEGLESAYVTTSSPGVSHEHSTLGLIQPHFIGLEKLRPRDLILVEMIMSNCNKER